MKILDNVWSSFYSDNSLRFVKIFGQNRTVEKLILLSERLLNIGPVTHFHCFFNLKNPNSILKIRNSKFQRSLR